MTLLTKSWMALIGLLFLGTSGAWAQVTVIQPTYSIAFGAGWELTDAQYTLVAKDSGIGGLAMMDATVDDGKPIDPQEQAKRLGDSLEATLTVGSNETRKIGAYSVQIIEFKYDQLRRVEREAKEQAGRDVSFKNGSFRAYYILSQGILLNILGIATLPFLTPYAGIEAAIPSLSFTPVGIFARLAHPPSLAWSIAGRSLRFAGKQPSAVAAYDGRGRLLGWLRKESGTEGWNLPVSGNPAFLMARVEGGSLTLLGRWRE